MRPARRERQKASGDSLSRKRKDYYAVLGVAPKAHATVIEEAYWDQAFRYHSKARRSRRASRRLQLLNEAYETLGSPPRRWAYDRARSVESAAEAQRGRGLSRMIGRLLARMSQA
jgi:curved DNA-binding protein CbpA